MFLPGKCYLYPWFDLFYTFIYGALCLSDCLDVKVLPCADGGSHSYPETGRIFGVTQVVEMYTVYIITGYHFPHQLHQVFFRRRCPGLRKYSFYREYISLFLFRNGFISQFGHMLFVSQRKGYHPCMTFHTPLMTFAHSKSQWIISRIAIYFSGQDGVIRFDRRFVEHISPCSARNNTVLKLAAFSLSRISINSSCWRRIPAGVVALFAAS